MRASDLVRVPARSRPARDLTPLALRSKAEETRPIDGLERQQRLKAGVSGRVDVARGAQGPVAIELGPVALKADGPARWHHPAGVPGPGGRLALEPRPAGVAQGPGARALQLSSWERNPLSTNNLRLGNRCEAAHAAQSSGDP